MVKTVPQFSGYGTVNNYLCYVTITSMQCLSSASSFFFNSVITVCHCRIQAWLHTLSMNGCCSFDSVSVTDGQMILMLTALLKTLSTACVPLFWEAVSMFSDLEVMQDGLTLLTWAMYFSAPSVDETSVAARVLAIMSGMVGVSDHLPACPHCGGATEFVQEVGDVFGW